jgi:hypothetical protein
MSADPWKQRVDAGDWTAITAEVNEYAARSPELLTAGEMSSPSSHPAVWRVHAASPNTDGYGAGQRLRRHERACRRRHVKISGSAGDGVR